MIVNLKDKRFHTNLISIYSVLPYKREYLPVLVLLKKILVNRAKGYKNQQEIVNENENLYGFPYSMSYSVVENNIFVTINFNVIDEKYVNDKKLLNKTIKFIYKLFYEFYEGRFTNKLIKEQKEIVTNQLAEIFNRPNYIAREGLYKALDENWLLSIPIYGTIEEVLNVTKADLIKVHQEIITAKKACFVVGPINKAKIEKSLSKYFSFTAEMPLFSEYRRSKDDVVEIVQEKKINQTVIQMGFMLDEDMNRFEATILNSLIGGLGTSRLFKEIREKRGLCYSISSSLSRYNRMLFISAGIDASNIDIAKESIKEILNNLKFTAKELNQAISIICSSITSSLDNSELILNDLVRATRMNEEWNYKETIKGFKKVSLSRINYLASKLVYQGIFVLKGVINI